MLNKNIQDLSSPRFWAGFGSEPSFEVTSGRLAVGDPCADPGEEGIHCIDGAKNGTWFIQPEIVERDQERLVWMLRVVHEKHSLKEECPWECLGKIEISSGLCGFFDAAFWQNLVGNTDDVFGQAVKSFANAPEWAKVMDRGVISQAGYGSGSYNCYYDVDRRGKVIEAEVLFFFDDEDRDGNPI